MYKIAICDDSEKELLEIIDLAVEYFNSNELYCETDSFSSSDQLMMKIENGVKYDALLLDICIPGFSGIEIANELLRQKIEIPVVFLTTSKEYALQAFGVHALRYLIKPLKKNEFIEAMDYIFSIIKNEHRRILMVKTETGQRTVQFREILFCEPEKNHTVLHLQNGDTLRVRGSMTKVSSELTEANDFVRAGASYIINLAHVRALETKCVLMNNGSKIPIPRRVFQEFRQSYIDYFCREDIRWKQ